MDASASTAAGRDLARNPDVVVRDVELVASGWHVLRRTTFDFHSDGRSSTKQREIYDRGHGAAILLHDTERHTVLLSRQFRFPVYVNGHPDGMLVETAAARWTTTTQRLRSAVKLGKGAVSAPRLDRPPAAEMDEVRPSRT